VAPEFDDSERPPIKITDKRRIRDDAATAPADEAGAGSGEPTPDVRAADDIADIDAARAEAAEYLDHLRRLQAEFDNYRKRVLKEQTDAVERASVPATQRLLEVLDDFELALMSANDKPDFDRFLHGVELVYAKLADTLKAEGLERIDALGKPFDPEQHEALMQTGEGEHLVVADVLRPGYTLRGRVIRPAGVRVNRE
jgi:molecular chaperone GrpE